MQILRFFTPIEYLFPHSTLAIKAFESLSVSASVSTFQKATKVKNDSKSKKHIVLSVVFHIKWGSRHLLVHSLFPTKFLHHHLWILFLWELQRNINPEDSASLSTAAARVWGGVRRPRNASFSSKLENQSGAPHVSPFEWTCHWCSISQSIFTTAQQKRKLTGN